MEHTSAILLASPLDYFGFAASPMLSLELLSGFLEEILEVCLNVLSLSECTLSSAFPSYLFSHPLSSLLDTVAPNAHRAIVDFRKYNRNV